MGILATGAENAQAGKSPKSIRQKTRLRTESYVTEPAKEIPVIASADIVIVGGGPAGVAAAISASRGGASVLLLERFTYLGGLWTGGEVLPVLNTHGINAQGERKAAVKGVMADITQRLFDMGMAIHLEAPRTDPEATKYILAEMIKENGVQVIYHSLAAQVITSGDRIEAVIMECKSGRVAVKGKFFIDCSGDGDIFCWAGEKFIERKHHIGVMWRIGNAENCKKGGPTPIKGVRLMHTDGERNQDGLDVLNLSRLQYNMRKYMWNTTEEIRKTEGCENVFMLDSPSQLGVRCTRVLESQHILTMEESVSYTSFKDVIGMSGGSASVTHKGKTYKGNKRPIWQIPYRSILPKKNYNLLVGGRCFGYDEELTYDAREIGTCFVTGQAAGTAAAIAIQKRCSAQDVDIAVLQDKLRQQGCLL